MAFAETFKALSDPVRRQILELLKEGQMSAGEIGSHFEMTGATISYHLKILKKADLVFETREMNGADNAAAILSKIHVPTHFLS